jgi:hypothetical protein
MANMLTGKYVDKYDVFDKSIQDQWDKSEKNLPGKKIFKQDLQKRRATHQTRQRKLQIREVIGSCARPANGKVIVSRPENNASGMYSDIMSLKFN